MQRFFRIGVLKNFAKLIGKQLCWCFFLIKLQALRPGTLLKRDSNTDIAKFLRTYSYKVPLSLRNKEIADPLAGKTYCIYQFKEKKIICSFRNMILVQVILRKIIPGNGDFFKVICNKNKVKACKSKN